MSLSILRAFCYGPLGLHLYAFLRFITGMGGIGCFMVCFVLAVEHVGFKVCGDKIIDTLCNNVIPSTP